MSNWRKKSRGNKKDKKKKKRKMASIEKWRKGTGIKRKNLKKM